MGFIQKIKNYRKKRNEKKRMNELTDMIDCVSKLFKSRLLLFDEKQKRLYIHNTLATVMLSKGEEGWRGFLYNVFLCLAYQQMFLNWESFFKEEEQKALKKAWFEKGKLSKADMEQIKLAVRDGVKKEDNSNMFSMEFEYVIIYDRGYTTDIVAVGYYNGETEELDIKPWNEVKHIIEEYNKKPTNGKNRTTAVA